MSNRMIIGIDEVGRGPLAGPVTVCACSAAVDFDLAALAGIRDSKKLSPKKREEWYAKLSGLKAAGLLDFALTSVPAADIDAIGIAPAIQRALDSSLDALAVAAEDAEVLLDGALKAPKKFISQKTIIKGDEKVPLISAASIVAKVMRDRYMEGQAKLHPQYGFEKHKGYGTAAHMKAIKKYGLTPLHRRSFLKGK